MTDIQFNLRIPKELKEKIKDAATENGRSINAEAQYRLEKSFEFLIDDSYYKNGTHIENKRAAADPRERRRLAKLAAEAVLQALSKDENN